MTDLRQEIYKKLNIYTKKYQQEYIKCLIRGIEIPINSRPEEIVRQLFLYFLIEESSLFPDIINIEVEVNNHDIEIYKKSNNDNFKPYQPPLIIVEIKRENINLQNHYNQIQRYLKKACSPIGILYNFYEIILFNRKNDNFDIAHLNSLKDVQNLILQVNSNIDNDILDFEKAQTGNFHSFTYLVSKYGKYTTNRIVFKIKQQEDHIAGYFFKIKNDTIYYDVCGKYSQKQQSFYYKDFERLISITY